MADITLRNRNTTLFEKLHDLGIDRFLSLPKIVLHGGNLTTHDAILRAISGLQMPTAQRSCILQVSTRPANKTTVSIEVASTGSALETKPSQPQLPGRAHLHDVEEATKVLDDTVKSIIATGTDPCASNASMIQIEVCGPDKPYLTVVSLPIVPLAASNLPSGKLDVEGSKIDNFGLNGEINLNVTICDECDVAQPYQTLFPMAEDKNSGELGVWLRLQDMDVDVRPTDSSIAPWRISTMQRSATTEKLHTYLFVSDHDFEVQQDVDEGFGVEVIPFHSLAIRLEQILARHTSNRSALISAELENQLKTCESELKELGHSRDSRIEQLAFLIDFSQNLKSRTEQALYDHPHFQDRMLRSRIATMIDEFAANFAFFGRRWNIDYGEGPSVITQGRPSMSFTHFKSPKTLSHLEYLEEIESKVLINSRGCELPNTHDPLLIGKLFAWQSEKWEGMADSLTEAIFSETEGFINDLAVNLAGSTAATALLNYKIIPELQKRKSRLREKTLEVLAPYKMPRALSWNPALLERMWNIEYQDYSSRLEGKEPLIAARRLAAAKLLQQAEAYYNVVQHNFVDNLAILAIEMGFLQQLPTLFTPKDVLALDANELAFLTAESRETVEARRSAAEKQDALEQAIKFCQTGGRFGKEGAFDLLVDADGITKPMESVSNTAAPYSESAPSKEHEDALELPVLSLPIRSGGSPSSKRPRSADARLKFAQPLSPESRHLRHRSSPINEISKQSIPSFLGKDSGYFEMLDASTTTADLTEIEDVQPIPSTPPVLTPDRCTSPNAIDCPTTPAPKLDSPVRRRSYRFGHKHLAMRHDTIESLGDDQYFSA